VTASYALTWRLKLRLIMWPRRFNNASRSPALLSFTSLPVGAKDEPLIVVNRVATLTDAERAAIGRLRGIYKVGGEDALEKALDELKRDSIKYVRIIAELSNEARK
jgi:hypothetical protein